MGKILSSNLDHWKRNSKRQVETVKINGKKYRGYGRDGLTDQQGNAVTVSVKRGKGTKVWHDAPEGFKNGSTYKKDKSPAGKKM